MAKTKREFIFGACILSGIGTVLNLVSLGSQNWVSGTLNDLDASVNYGLFVGDLLEKIPQEQHKKLLMTCILSENICALMSGDSNFRTDSLTKIYKGGHYNDTTLCNEGSADTKETAVMPGFQENSGPIPDRKYINAGVLICTIMFLCLSAILGLISSVLAVWNTASNPVEVYLSIFGLYVYNGIACFTVLMTLILWGSTFAASIADNIAVCFSLVLYIKDKDTSLGYSYWLNLPTLFLYAGSIAVLYLRQYLINKEPTVNVHLEGEVDPGIYLY